MAESIRCPRCRRPIDVGAITTSPDAHCPSCRRSFEAVRFDPVVRTTVVAETVDGRLGATQPCVNHPRNAAVTSCERCGSFMCALCRIDLDGRTLCPACFERLSTDGTLESTRTTFRDYPGLASVTAVAGLLLWFATILLGPLSIYYAVKGLRQKKQMGESDGRVGLWFAILLGSIEAAGGALLVGFIVWAMMQGTRR